MICQGALSPAQLLITSTDPLGITVCKHPDPQTRLMDTLEDVFMLTRRELGFTPRLPNSTNLTSHLLRAQDPVFSLHTLRHTYHCSTYTG